MPNRHGDFLWYELLTTDLDAAAAFYETLVGWKVEGSGQPGMDYRLLSSNGVHVGGMMALPEGAVAMGQRPGWFGYIAVEDVDATVTRITAAGGALHMPAWDIPNVGRLAMVADPQGVVFYVMRGSVEGGVSTSFSPNEVGHCSWNELTTTDPAAAFAFYGSLFGWAKGDAMPMGEMGDYQFLTHGGRTIGATMQRQADGPPATWTFYFQVADIDAATKRAREAGAQILHGPAEVPGGEFIILGADPQGAMFALVGKRS